MGLLSVGRAVCTWGTAPRGCPMCCYCLLGSTTLCGGLGGQLGSPVGVGSVYSSYSLRARGVSAGFGTKPEMPLCVLQASQCYRLWLGCRGYVTFSAACYRLLTLWRVSKLTGSGASSPPSRGNPIPICKVLTCTSIICAHVDRLSSELCVDWATLLSVSAMLN